MRVLAVLKTSRGATWFVRQTVYFLGAGHAVTVVLPDATDQLGQELTHAGARVVQGPAALRATRPHRVPLDLLRLRRVIRDAKPDVLFYQLFSSAVSARLASVRLAIPRVHMVPGPLFLESPLTRAIERLLVRFDDVVIAGSAYTAGLYRQLGIPEDRLVVTPYGVDLDRFVPVTQRARQRARASLGLPQIGFVAIMVGYVYGPKRLVHRGRPIKGHATLLDAWWLFRRAGGTGHLVIVGGGFDARGEHHRQELLRQLTTEADASVRWLNSVADVEEYYAAADVSVAPSLSENHGAAVEASALGLPSIVSSAGGLPEVIDNSRGWVVPPEDAAALAVALCEAGAASCEELRGRGQRAREHIVDSFELGDCNGRVLDALVGAASRRRSG